MNDTKIIVSVIVVTYNQECWIRQTLDSILAQKTEYNFEIVIGEDFGTDGTRAICIDYAKKHSNVKLLPQHSNLGVTGNYVQCLKACKGKYIMCCAGDDYWHNPNKIQLQVDFMENHPDCVLCHTDLDILYVKNGRVIRNRNSSRGVRPPEGMIQTNILSGKDYISAVTICMRRDVVLENVPLNKFVELEFPREDWPLLIIISAYGEIRYIPVSTATYRVGHVSITNTIDYDKIIKRVKADKRMTEYLYSLFPSFGPFKDDYYFNTQVYHLLLNAAYENNDFKSAHEFAKKDPTKGFASKMASNIVLFKLFRFYRNYIRSIVH